MKRRRPGLALLVALLAATPYAVCLALPYYVNGVHRRPAGETIFAYDGPTLASREVVLYVAAAAVGIASVAWLATSLANELIMWFWD